MEENDFKIRRVNGTLIIEKDGQGLAISQAVDNDIWFTTSKNELSLEISKYSSIYSEWQIYLVFEYLMKAIVGRYILSGDNKNEFSILPEDFVDLDSNVITWHSDSGTDNILKLEYNEKIITISILKSKDALTYESNAVRIRTSGSSYGYYYQEFLELFSHLSNLEDRLNKTTERVELKEEEYPNQKKLSLFGKSKKKEDNSSK
ncbi:MAG: hypothetical protein IJD92_05225 [Bacilli bacterium]|nr:hypothetical protein [Bacilli bacterium]